ncbi:CsgG/HfaB family protein [uncultured Duncaniella sp.]|uniref:CsgG/HfaB family protein n=2 Tax=uncultured Duncaniella sp. TaxID=2768039 RepID=UPI00345B8924
MNANFIFLLMVSKNLLILSAIMLLYGFTASAQKTVNIEEPTIQSKETQTKTMKRKVAIGRFTNETEYGKGLFYDKENDPMGKQALDILSAKLAASEKFLLLERNDLAALLEEANRNGQSSQQAIGADYMIIGSITEFGRKTTSQTKVFSASKTQTVEAAVNLRLIDVTTGQIIFSDEGKGAAEITTKSSFVGTGGHAGYDATLSDKAISAAIDQLVENVINKLSDKPWRSYFLTIDSDAIIIVGGQSQGIEPGMEFNVLTRGKQVKNPQTGIMITLPGKEIAKIKVEMTGGETPETEYAIVSVTNGEINAENINNYIIEEPK